MEVAIMLNPGFALKVNLNSDRKETGELVWVPSKGKLPNLHLGQREKRFPPPAPLPCPYQT